MTSEGQGDGNMEKTSTIQDNLKEPNVPTQKPSKAVSMTHSDNGTSDANGAKERGSTCMSRNKVIKPEAKSRKSTVDKR